MRSFIATGHFVPIYVQTLPDVVGMVSSGSGSRAARLSFYRQHQLVPPRNYMIGRMGSRHSLRVVFYEVDRGLLLIQAPSIHGAYDVLRAVQAFFCLAGGHGAPVDRDFDALIEVNKIPKPSWSASDLMMNIRQGNVLGVLGIQSLSDGIAISAEEMQHIAGQVQHLFDDQHLSAAMAHLGHSRFLFYGFMVGSFYTSHYQRERRALRRRDLEKRYLEHRERYELAFVAGFKGIECLLGVGQLRKREIARVLARLPYGSRAEDRYTRWHEIFSGYPRSESYEGMIGHFLDIRNAVAAHANPSPPRRFMLSEDSIYELQLFVGELGARALGAVSSTGFPRGALLRSTR